MPPIHYMIAQHALTLTNHWTFVLFFPTDLRNTDDDSLTPEPPHYHLTIHNNAAYYARSFAFVFVCTTHCCIRKITSDNRIFLWFSLDHHDRRRRRIEWKQLSDKFRLIGCRRSEFGEPVFPFQPRWQPVKRWSLFFSPSPTAIYAYIDAAHRYTVK